MKNIPIAIKILINTFFLSIYWLIWIILWNFLYWLFLTIFWKSVPWKSDPIHFKIAWVIIIWIIIITIVFRKYFYLPLNFNYKFKNNSIKKNKKNINSEKMEIYIDKEIK